MKKHLLFSLSFSLCAILSAQEILPVQESLNRSINENENFILVQQYNLVWYYSGSIWEHTRYVTYTYNDLNNPTEKFESWTDGSGPYKKTICNYDANQNLDEERVYLYSDTGWVNSAKDLYNYDANNIRIQKTWLEWDGVQFVNQMKETYSYNANNQKIYSMMYYWDDDVWKESQQFDYQYDENNFLYKISSKILDENVWVNHQKSIFTYDTITGNLMNVKTSNWDTELSQWSVPQMQQNYTYNQDNNRIIFIIQQWDEYGEDWYNLYKSDYYYVPTGSISVENTKSGINKSIQDFQTTEDDIIIYPVKEDKVLIGIEVLIDSVLHTSDGDLEFTLSHNGITETIIYHEGGDGDNFLGTKLSDRGVDSIANGIAPFYGIYKPENPLSAFLETDPAGTWTLSIYDGVAGNTGTLQSWGLYLIYAPNMGVEEESAGDFSFEIFPNPAQNKFEVRGSKFEVENFIIELFDLNGRKLVEKNFHTGTENIEFDVSGLKNGVYFCKISTQEYAITKRLIIQK